MLTVLTPAASYDLVTLAAAKAEMEVIGNADDAVLASFIRQASSAVSSYCQRVFPQELVTETFRLGWGSKGPIRADAPLHLSRTPVASVTAITDNETILTPDAYARFDELNTILAKSQEVCVQQGLPANVKVLGAKGSVEFRSEPIHEYRDLWDIDDRVPQLAWLWQLNRGVFKSPGSKWESWTTSIVHSDADVQRYVDNLEGSHIEGSVEHAGQLGISAVRDKWEASLRLRYLGEYALVPDNSQRAGAETTVGVRGAYRFGRAEVYADLLNLLDGDGKDIVYWYPAYVEGLDPAGLTSDDIDCSVTNCRMSRAEEPRTLRVGVKFEF